MNENDKLEQEHDSKSTSQTSLVPVEPNKFKSLIEDFKDPMFFWNLSQSFKDFTDAVSMSAVAQAFKSAFNSATNAISNFTNRIKESIENKRNNDPSKMGINVSTIEVQNKPISDIITPTTKGQVQEKSASIIDNAKSAEDIRLEATEKAAENGVKLDTLDSSAIIEEKKKDEIQENTISAGEIVTNQPAKEEKEGEDR